MCCDIPLDFAAFFATIKGTGQSFPHRRAPGRPSPCIGVCGGLPTSARGTLRARLERVQTVYPDLSIGLSVSLARVTSEYIPARLRLC